MIDVLPSLRDQFQRQVALFERRPGVFQVAVPLYHEDGDMVDLYLEDAPETGKIRVFDAGMTLMRLSYTIEDLTPARQRVLDRMVAEAGLREEGGSLFLDVSAASLVPAVLHLAQAEARIGTIRLFRREIIAGLFQEEFDELVESLLAPYHPRRREVPIPERDDLEVDWALTVGGRPLYLFGVRDAGKARLATIACQAFQLQQLVFRSAVVHEDMASLPKKDQVRITSAADKQFPSLDDFRSRAPSYFAREAAAQCP